MNEVTKKTDINRGKKRGLRIESWALRHSTISPLAKEASNRLRWSNIKIEEQGEYSVLETKGRKYVRRKWRVLSNASEKLAYE